MGVHSHWKELLNDTIFGSQFSLDCPVNLKKRTGLNSIYPLSSKLTNSSPLNIFVYTVYTKIFTNVFSRLFANLPVYPSPSISELSSPHM